MTADPTAATLDVDLERLYREEIRTLAAGIRVDRRLQSPDFTATRRGRFCGSEVSIDGKLSLARCLTQVGFRTRACSLGLAATAIVVRNAPGCALADIEALRALLRDRLAGADRPPPQAWRQLRLFDAARPVVGLHAAILLPFDALVEGFGSIADR